VPLLLAAVGPTAPPATRREALRLLTTGRLKRLDPLAYDVGEVAVAETLGFLPAAVERGEALLRPMAPGHPCRELLRRAVAAACDGLFAYHCACGDLAAARAAVGVWLRWARPDADLPAALSRLAAWQRLSGDERGRVETLSRLAHDFADQPEGAEARRQLMLLDTGTRRRH